MELYQIMIIVWAAFIIVNAIIELITIDLVIIWFTLGAVGALIASIFKAPLYVQVIIFVVLSFASLLATRPLAKKMQKNEIIKTNADKIIGEYVVVTTEIPENGAGEIQYEGKYWRAVSSNNTFIEKGAKVIVQAISGAKVIVTKESDKIENKEKIL